MPVSAVTRSLAKQSVKTAVAGVASLYAAKLCKLPEDYWASISALIVMQSNLGATVSASWTRLAGTAVGAVVGLAFMVVWGANVTAFGVAVAIAFYICSVLKLAESQRLATVTVAILMLIGRTSSPWTIALHRFLEVSIGILVAMVISLVLWPSRAREALRKGIGEALTEIEEMYLAVSRGYRTGEPPEIETLRARLDDLLLRNRSLLQHATFERVTAAEQHEFLALLMDHVDRIFDAVVAVELATRAGVEDTYVRNSQPQLERLERQISMAFEWLAPAIVTWRFDRAFPDLAAAVAELDEKAVALRRAGTSRTYELEELLRFYGFVLSLKNLAKELDLAHEMLMAPRTRP